MDTARTLLTTLPHRSLQFVLLRLEVSHYLHSFFSHLLIDCSIFILPLGTVFSSFYYHWSIFILPLVAPNLKQCLRWFQGTDNERAPRRISEGSCTTFVMLVTAGSIQTDGRKHNLVCACSHRSQRRLGRPEDE